MQTKRSNTGALIGGAVLIAFGLLSLASQLFRGLNWDFLWPLTVVGFGALFFVLMFAGGKQAAGFAIPGSIITGIGLVLLFQSITHHWSSMSYFWTLILMFVGAGIYIMGLYGEDESRKQSGSKLMKIGFILFVIFGSLFELVFSTFLPSGIRSIIFPLLLILLGGYLVLSRSGLLGGKKNDTSQSNESLPPTI